MKFLTFTLLTALFAFSAAQACDDNICVGDRVYILNHKYHSVVEGINTYKKLVTARNSNTHKPETVSLEYIAVTKGCTHDHGVCVGDRIIHPNHQFQSEVIGIFNDGGFYARNTNTRGPFKNYIQNVSHCSKVSGKKICVWK